MRAFKKLNPDVKKRGRQGLEKLAIDAAGPGLIGGKTVKTIQVAGDAFHRLRVGDHRIMYDVLVGDRVILVLGIVHRSELERWVRNR